MTMFWVVFIAVIVIGLAVRVTQASAPPNPQMICPHCQTKGRVKTMRVRQKKGISGGKATGAVLTGGVSLFATGLSRKETGTSAHCLACGSRWVF